MNKINPTNTRSWKCLKKHFEEMKRVHIKDLFIQDPNRFKNFSINFDNQMLVDFSKNIITTQTMNKLQCLAEEMGLNKSIKSFFSGEKINQTENCAALHIALRNISNKPIFVDGTNVMIEVNIVLEKMNSFSKLIIDGDWKGYTGKAITDVVNIGIGGSDLGPLMVTEALRPYKNHLIMHFVSNIDSSHITEILKKINAETTIFLIASKTFTTQETITNANSARNWFLSFAKKHHYISKHFIAMSSNIKEVNNFDMNITKIFKCWNWVGGRYSIWSAMGLSIMISIGFDNFKKLLSGAHAMDNHFSNQPFNKNIPVILALIGIWYNNFFKMETEAILPYDQYLYRLPAYLQQCNMESNGKCVDRNGNKINYQSGPIVWGEPGTNGQHAFYQLIHQGTKIIPCDFIASAISHNTIYDHHTKLLSNFFAQTKALAFGKSRQIVEQEYLHNRKILNDISHVIPFKIFEGNRPSNSILIKKITPFNLGILISMYEHKIFTQGIIFNVYTFDQWGVELGKKLANSILVELNNQKKSVVINDYDSSTNGLINQYKNWC